MKRPSAAASAQIFASIDDLLIQVFLRLPLKQLYRLKLVCKHWDSILSDPKKLLQLSPEPAIGLIFNCRIIAHHHLDNPYKSYFLNINQPTTTPAQLWKSCGDEVLHSCNGLLLCTSGFRHYYIYNPITKKTSNLGNIWTSDILGVYLAFDPFESCHYKFVCVVGLGGYWSRRFKFQVYSSKTGSWRKCGDLFSATVEKRALQVYFAGGGVYWKGAIHWVSLTKAGKSFYFNPGKDDDRMLPTAMPSPPILEDADRRFSRNCGVKQPPWYKGRNYHFEESCGHLHFIDAYIEEIEFNVYEMKTDYSEWLVKYKVDLLNVVVRGSLFSICTMVRGKKDDDGGTFLVLRIGKKFIRCNLVDKSTCETLYECKGNNQLEEELLGHDGEFPLHYIEEGAYGNHLDGVWYTEEEIIAQDNARGIYYSKRSS